jgi:hypothetical protein
MNQVRDDIPFARRPACASGQASQLSADDVLKHLPVQRQVCDQLLQLAVLILKLLQPPHLSGQQPVELLLPIVIGCLADPSFRQMSATGTPSLPCFRINAFWASENFEAFITLRSSQPGNRCGKL